MENRKRGATETVDPSMLEDQEAGGKTRKVSSTAPLSTPLLLDLIKKDPVVAQILINIKADRIRRGESINPSLVQAELIRTIPKRQRDEIEADVEKQGAPGASAKYARKQAREAGDRIHFSLLERRRLQDQELVNDGKENELTNTVVEKVRSRPNQKLTSYGIKCVRVDIRGAKSKSTITVKQIRQVYKEVQQMLKESTPKDSAGWEKEIRKIDEGFALLDKMIGDTEDIDLEEFYGFFVDASTNKLSTVKRKRGVSRAVRSNYFGICPDASIRLAQHRKDAADIRGGTYKLAYTAVKPKIGEMYRLARAHPLTIENAESVMVGVKGRNNKISLNQVQPYFDLLESVDPHEYLKNLVETCSRSERLVKEGYGHYVGSIE